MFPIFRYNPNNDGQYRPSNDGKYVHVSDKDRGLYSGGGGEYTGGGGEYSGGGGQYQGQSESTTARTVNIGSRLGLRPVVTTRKPPKAVYVVTTTRPKISINPLASGAVGWQTIRNEKTEDIDGYRYL